MIVKYPCRLSCCSLSKIDRNQDWRDVNVKVMLMGSERLLLRKEPTQSVAELGASALFFKFQLVVHRLAKAEHIHVREKPLGQCVQEDRRHIDRYLST